jgi:hypothetical protein
VRQSSLHRSTSPAIPRNRSHPASRKHGKPPLAPPSPACIPPRAHKKIHTRDIPHHALKERPCLRLCPRRIPHHAHKETYRRDPEPSVAAAGVPRSLLSTLASSRQTLITGPTSCPAPALVPRDSHPFGCTAATSPSFPLTRTPGGWCSNRGEDEATQSRCHRRQDEPSRKRSRIHAALSTQTGHRWMMPPPATNAQQVCKLMPTNFDPFQRLSVVHVHMKCPLLDPCLQFYVLSFDPISSVLCLVTLLPLMPAVLCA